MRPGFDFTEELSSHFPAARHQLLGTSGPRNINKQTDQILGRGGTATTATTITITHLGRKKKMLHRSVVLAAWS